MSFQGGANAYGRTDYLAAKGTVDAVGAATSDEPVNTLRPISEEMEAIYVQGLHSVAGATAKIQVLLYDEDSLCMGEAAPGERTLTAGFTRQAVASLLFRSPMEIFATAGASFWEVRITEAPSSGTVTLRSWGA